MTYWAYRCGDEERWHEARVYQPSAPPPMPGEGFPKFHVERDGVSFCFASLHELRICIDVLSRKVLPTTAQLISGSGLKKFSNHAWLGRLPAGTHSWRYRQKAVPYLRKALAAFESVVPNQKSPAAPPEPKTKRTAHE